MKINTMPKEIACELLTYIADKENFETSCQGLGESVTSRDIKALLRELSAWLQAEIKEEKGETYDAQKCNYLSADAKKIISCLTPKEEKTLLKVFGFTEEKKNEEA